MEALSVHYSQPFSAKIVSNELKCMVKNDKCVLLCIGTDRSTGDSLGPLVGHFIKDKLEIPVYGTIDDPVHAANLSQTIDDIKLKYPGHKVIAVDACLSRMENVGFVVLERGPMSPGAAVKKDLGTVGDFSIKGNVNVGGFMEHLVLQSTRLNLVMKMAEIIADAIYDVFGVELKGVVNE